jgi:pyruvate dehydrogenase E2 component (dihydrolipoamide acetyltransferase)
MADADRTTRAFALPDLGEGLEDAVLDVWHVAVGDTVVLNQPLCTVETAKATVELPSPYAGTVVERTGEPGETIEVGAVLVRIDVGVAEVAGEPRTDQRTPTLVGYGPQVGPSRRRRRGPAEVPSAPPPVAMSPERVLAKPPVRKLAREQELDITSLAPGSGPDGIVTRADVDRAAAARAISGSAPAGSDEVIRVHGVRARIAEHMTRSRSTIPDASCGVTVDCARLLALRASLRETAKQRTGADVLTPFTMILRLLVSAIQSRPILNSTFDAEAAEIRVHGAIHLGIGTDTPSGLVVPVVRNAEQHSTLGLAAEVRRLAESARAGTLAPSHLVGSTFTVSNFGMFGLDEGYPVINHPEAAILGIGAIRERPVVVDGELVARPTASLTCSFDHRVCDGADAGAFLGRLRELIEAPEQLLLEL